MLTVSNGEDSSQASASINVMEKGDTDMCGDFGVPLPEGLPDISSSYSHAHVLGSNGPDLSHVNTFTINWSLLHKGLWQFSMNTGNGDPDWYVDLRLRSSHTFSGTEPGLTFSGSGFPGLDGDYWVTVDGENFVMVRKDGRFAIYFSNSEQPPCE